MMRPGRPGGRAAAAALLLAVLAAACGGRSEQGAGAGRTVSITMRDIAFEPARLEVAAGETVEFVFQNTGQTEHEAVIGDEAFQESQEGDGPSGHAGGHQGSEHVPRVVLAPGREGKLKYTFDEPGTLFIGCHVPNHWDAGMKVAITVS